MSASPLIPVTGGGGGSSRPRFQIDPSLMPQLPVRKGLLILDFQSDFLDAEGQLPVSQPKDFVNRTVALANEFRKKGDVFWVCSEFEKHRPVTGETVLVTDELPQPNPSASGHSRRRTAKPALLDPTPINRDPEGFLSQGGAACVRSPSGAQVPAHIKETIGRRDVTFIKSHYSAFKSGQLLQLLRGKFVTKLYICGSLTNVGVYATAVDAAMYGYDIVIVEDCCGFRSATRQKNAMQAIFDATGCDVVQSGDVPKDMIRAPGAPRTDEKPPSPAKAPAKAGGLSHRSSNLHEKLAALNLSDPAASRKQRPHHDPLPVESLVQDLEVDPDAQPAPNKKADSRPKEDSGSTKTLGSSSPQPSSTKTTPSEPRAKSIKEVPDPKLVTAPEVAPDPTDSRKEQAKELVAPVADPKAAPEPSLSTSTTPNPPEAPKTSGPLCEGDTTVIYDLLPPSIEAGIFEKLKDEVEWQKMSHQGGEVPRLVAVQGDVADDGSMPVYRHPSDESPPLLPFSPTVLAIKSETEKHLGHALNHVLIQYYRGGTDYISEHSDKTLDIVKGSYISNVSLGAERTMVFRTKRKDRDPPKTKASPEAPSSPERPSKTPTASSKDETEAPKTEPAASDAPETKRKIQRAKLPHNSLCRMGLTTNESWLHAIKQDKRADRDKTDTELAFSGGRISLTFRQIGTFLNKEGTLIWGQGATSKTREGAQPTVNGQCDEMVGMLIAFGKENHSSSFDWDAHYGKGFDVLHMRSSPRLFFSPDEIVNLRITLMLAEFGISYAKGSMAGSSKEGAADADNGAGGADGSLIRFMDNDASTSVVQGDLAIMLYLDALHGSGKAGSAAKSQAGLARSYSRFQQGLAFDKKWRTIKSRSSADAKRVPPSLKKELADWNAHAAAADFIAGPGVTLADFAFWPVLHDVVQVFGSGVWDGLEPLHKFYQRILERDSTKKVLSKARASSHGPSSENGKDADGDKDHSVEVTKPSP